MKNEGWVNLGIWVQPTLSACFWDNWSHDNHYPFDIKFDGGVLFLDGHTFVRKEDIEIARKFIQKNKGNFELLKSLENWVDDLHDKAKKFKIHGNTKPNLIIGSLQEFITLYKDITNPWVFFILVEEAIKDLDEYKKLETFGIPPLKEPYLIKLNKEAKKLYKKLSRGSVIKELNIEHVQKRNKDLAIKIRNHTKKFEFCGVHHFVGEPYTIERFFMNFKIDNDKQESNKILIPLDLMLYYQLLSLTTFVRTHMAETSGMLQWKTKSFFNDIGKQTGVGNDYIWMSATELVQALKKPIIPGIEQRKKGFGLFSENGNQVIVIGKKLNNLIKKYVVENIKSEFPLKGMIASKGKVIGKVRLVIKPEDIEKVRVGDILVAPETTPDFVRGMQKAAGIITNRGGITSHAAIVSREFKIPCIVGVENATKILKDNQLIELDAEKGEIRQL